VAKAFIWAERIHHNQKRDAGTPYLEEHIYPLVESIIARYSTEEGIEQLLIVTILHDILEDGGRAYQDELKRDFGSEVLASLKTLSKPADYDSDKATQEEKLRVNREKVALLMQSELMLRIVKLEDRLNNIQCILQIGTNPKYVRYLHETESLYLPLAKTVHTYYVNALQSEIDRLTRPVPGDK